MGDLPLAPPPGANAPTYTQRELSVAGAVLDRNLLTRAGRAIQKHLSRSRVSDWQSLARSMSVQTTARTAIEYNEFGQDMLDFIIANPNTIWNQRRVMGGAFVVDARLPNGLGARWEQVNPPVFKTFLD